MNLLKLFKKFIIKYKHAAILSYFFVYMIWFTFLERSVTTKFYPIESKLDQWIPFSEVFVIPYFLWFIYIAATVIYFLFTSKSDFYKFCANIFIGMTICLTIYTIWPNGHYLRADLDTLGRSNIFTSIIGKLYAIDTATNVFPSIHVFNSIAAYIAIHKSEALRRLPKLQFGALILTILICMSTVLLKQHSILDIFGAMALNMIMYVIVYVPSRSKVSNNTTELSKI